MAATESTMELTYSNQLGGFDPGKRYRNPEHFDKPEAGVTSVLVIGDWPNVVDAYENVGIEVTLKEAPPRQVLVVGAGNSHVELEELIGNLRAESNTVRAVIVGLEAGEIEKPEAGELAIRLYDALEHIRVKVDELATSRDALATENEALRSELAELKAGEGAEVEALKAKLDAAGVTFRANASKESLEKLVADLPKA
jgi:regulator of replication initiation timing